ncbi:uncharacterized protein AB675_9479 [Cyphellophora attinorum]|uniref:Tyrosinase copper-binding domain-containing protein n=1 Tax=Cyphellophora attinorum TaxID=1664694 RepID=A0A0N1P1X4_9EURO|nr:uncharacterized protein AB675_9479 [Phialophora attinorum]KPI42540.1 hypothetical protein AB675_9479 [Phialophora attinorum]
MRSVFVWASLALSAFAAPNPKTTPWGDWNDWSRECNPHNVKIRRDFDKLPTHERKAFTDAINCLRDQPSGLDQQKYSAAINRFFDYAVVHTNLTSRVHLDGYFLTWHRMFVWLFEKDLQETCGWNGTMPYWNWPGTAGKLESAPIFDGSEYSMSGNGLPNPLPPVYALGPNFSLPRGSGGGCVTTGPFAGMNYTMQVIPSNLLSQGAPLPPTTFVKNESCLTRDLNDAVSTLYLNQTAYEQALAAPDQATFSVLLNGVFGGAALACTPLLTSQSALPLARSSSHHKIRSDLHPEIADQLYGTMTAVNIPPSANVTLESVVPDFGYFKEDPITIGELISTTAGPFCYRYEYPGQCCG